MTIKSVDAVHRNSRAFSGRSRLWFGFGAAATLLAVGVASASATSPGHNGRIAFRRYFDPQQSWGAVYVVGADGKGAQQITRPPRGVVDDQPDWAPDGSAIAFTRCAEGATCHVWIVAPDGTGVAPVGPLCRSGANETKCPDDGGASFSRNSKQLAFAQATGRVKHAPGTGDQIEHASIAIMNLDGTGRHVVYTTKPFAADLAYPVFSPDGKRIVFEQHNSGLSTSHIDRRAVFVIGVDGAHLMRITPWNEDDGDNPDWSPNGKWILFRSHQDDPSRQSQYIVVHPDGTGRKQLTHFPTGTHLASASFSPDGTSIVLAKGPEGGNIDVYRMPVAGGHLRRLTTSPLWESAPDWGSA